MLKEVMFYHRSGDITHCQVCPQKCRIKPGGIGFCKVRENMDGTLYATNYGDCAAIALDPIEKKPLYHYYPGSSVLSIGARGCNLHCGFCQNWHLAHGNEKGHEKRAEDIVALAQKYAGQNCIGIAYTYSEPLMWYEFVYDTVIIAREKGLKNVLVSNGFINEAPLKAILPYIDGMNIDVKAFTNEFYKKYCKGQLDNVMKTVESVYGKCHLEITTLVIPGLNDSIDEILELAEWIGGLDRDIPLHLSRYFPNYNMNKPATPMDTLTKAQEAALSCLNYVYLGNVRDGGSSNTYCPQCGEMLIDRTRMNIDTCRLDKGKCWKCGFDIKVSTDN